MKPTRTQTAVLELIESGYPHIVRTQASSENLDVISFQWSRDGNAIVAHRTVRTQKTDNPRLDYRVEMFRIQRDGTVARL